MTTQIIKASSIKTDILLSGVEGEIINSQVSNVRSSSRLTLQSLNIQQDNGVLNAKGIVTHDNQEKELILEGNLYPMIGEGYYSNNLVLGDITGDEEYNVLKFTIENKPDDSTAMLSIVLEVRESGEWIQFKHEINQETFDSYFNGATVQVDENNIDEEELKEATLNLLNSNARADHGEDLDETTRADVSGVITTDNDLSVDSSNARNTISVNFTELNRLMTDLKRTGRVNLSNYNVPESLFRGTGWKQDVSITNSARNNYYAASSNQGAYTLTQISVFQHDIRFQGWTDGPSGTGNNTLDTLLRVVHGMIVDYDHHSRDISVVYYNWGLSFQDVEIAQGRLSGTNVYTAKTINGSNLTSRPGIGNAVRMFAALVPHASTVLDVWDNLQLVRSPALNTRETFVGATYANQVSVHNNRVYRNIAGHSHGWNLINEGANFTVTGEINSGSGSITVGWGYAFTASTSLA